MSEWDNLTETELAAVRKAFETTEAQRQAFNAWEAKSGRAKVIQYRDMTPAERAAFHRRIGVRQPHGARA